MTRPPRRRLAGALTGLIAGTLALGTLGPVVGPAAPASAAPGDEEAGDPLTVTVDRITPGTVPARGPVRVTGRVTNTSEDPWSELSVYLVTSRDPIVDRETLAEAVASDPLAECPQVCSRIVEPGLFADVPDLEPGETVPFRLSVPRGQLGISGDPGVYWLGVQVLGSNPDGRLPGADGRARTFLPLVPPRAPGTRLAVGVQVRNHTVRDEDGRLEFLPGWERALRPHGRLGRLLDLTSAADDFPLSLVVDPAVLDAATSVAAGNPPLELGTPAEVEGDPDGGTDDPSPTTEPSPTAPGEDEDAAELSPEAAEAALVAGSWVEEFVDQARTHEVHRLPYGDLDVAASHEVEPDLLDDALATGDAALREHEVTSSPLLAPLPGTLPPEAVRGLDSGVPVVLDDGFVPTGAAVRQRERGGLVLVDDPALVAGGPGPTPPDSALSVRQRLLAEAALHALSDRRREPLVALLPATWDPGPRWRAADLFGGLDVPWLRPATLSELSTGPGPALTADAVEYPEAQDEAELPSYAVIAAAQLRELGATTGDLLADDGGFAGRVDRLALLTASTFSRVRPGLAVGRNRGLQDHLRTWLGRIAVRGPSFVTMSSESGTFQVTLVNQLDEPVTVGLRATASGEQLTLRALPETVVLEPKGRTSMQVDATAADIGVHRVSLQPVTSTGEPVGSPLELSIRTSQVGLVVWLVMVAGGVLLLAAISVRITRRITGRRRTRSALTRLEDE